MTTNRHPRSIVASALVLAIAASALAASAGAADQRDYRDQNHNEQQQQHGGWGHDYQVGGHHWRRGERIGYNDWAGAQPVDYRSHHLRQPPRGYEWRESNGQYVLAAVATGLIASIILNGAR
jgi:Ni/Co efflux regulator RcnB